MMKRVFLMFYNRDSGINEAAFLLGVFTFFSQILGLIRDRLLATYVGAGFELDAYYAAFKIPDFLYISIATLASITVLLPLFTKKYNEGTAKDIEHFKQTINQVFTVLVYFLIGISIILFVCMPVIVPVITPGFSLEQQETATLLARIMLLQPIFIGISGMISSITQFFKKFLITALTPVMYNIGIIFGIIVFYPNLGITGLAFGVVLGALLHLGIQLPLMVYQKTLPKITTTIDWKDIRELVTLSIPRTLGLSISSITVIFLTALASFLGAGSIALFTLTQNILNVPLAIIGVSYSVAAFPVLVKHYNDADFHNFIQRIMHGSQKIIFWAFPATVLFIILRAQIVRVVLGTNSFSWNDTRIASAILAVFMVGLVAQSLVQMLVRGMYAMGETKKTLYTSFISQIIVVILALSLLHIFTRDSVIYFVQYILRLQGVADIRVLALPFAFAIGNIINCSLLVLLFIRKFPDMSWKPIAISFGQVFLATIGMASVAYSILYVGSLVFNQETFLGILLQGGIAGLSGIAVGFILLYMLQNQDVLDFLQVLKKRFWKTKVVQDAIITP